MPLSFCTPATMTSMVPLGAGLKPLTKEHIPGRTVPSFTSKNLTTEQRHKVVLKELGWDLSCYSSGATRDGSIRSGSEGETSADESMVPDSAALLLVKALDMNAEENCKVHHTVDYVIASPRVKKDTVTPGTLIVRRGTEFTVKLLFNRNYNKENDQLHFVFELVCDETKVSKASLYSLDVREGLKFASWSVCYDNKTDIWPSQDDVVMVMVQPETASQEDKDKEKTTEEEPEKKDGDEKEEPEKKDEKEEEEKPEVVEPEVEVEAPGSPVDMGPQWQSFIVRTPPDCIVGRWTLSVDTIDKVPSKKGRRKIHRFTCQYPLYILFNAWNRADQVFMENENLRDEYVLNEYGKIVTGNYKQITTKPWLYGQFESFVLDCCFHLLDVAGCAHQVRKDAAEICKALTNIITSSDNKSGLLLHSWASNYTDGKMAPSSWTGSTAILEQYWRTKHPVKYGHCYVFAGVATTFCRALGIPCRPVTAFCSVHDCDRLMTIDTHWCMKGNPIRRLNEDVIWSFHVWNEAWMRRPDLFENYAGWQAFDTTPQITSHGVGFAGPSPVKAIKTGNVNVPFNTELLFTEINADIVNWFFEDEGIWKSRIVKYRTGKSLYTKKARPAHRRFLAVRTMKLNDSRDIDDITRNYKFEEGSEEDRSALYRADVAACHAGVVDIGKPDVKFEIKHLDDIIVGSVFDVTVKVQNQNRNNRTVDLTLELFTAYYTGVQKSRIKYETFHFELGAIRTEDAVVHVVAEEYLHRMADHACFKINVLGTVLETGQVFCEQDDFRLGKPELEIDIPRKVVLGSSFNCKVHFMNPTPISLVRCEWILEATGIQKSIKLTRPILEPYEIVDLDVALTPFKLGTQYVVVTFNSREVMDVSGVSTITVMLQEEYDLEKEIKVTKKGTTSKTRASEMVVDAVLGDSKDAMLRRMTTSDKGYSVDQITRKKSSHTSKHSRDPRKVHEIKSVSKSVSNYSYQQ